MGRIENGIEYIDQNEGAQIVDDLARKLLGMSGLEFVVRYRNGDLANYDGCDRYLKRVSMMLPLVGESSVYGRRSKG